MDTQPKSSRRGIIVGVVIVVVFIAVVAGAVVWALTRDRAPEAEDRAAIMSAYESAMRKARVEAPFPAEPVELTSVTASGGHPFSATFTAEEISALLWAFRHTADVNGSTVTLPRAKLRLAGGDSIELTARVDVDGKNYGAVVEAPVSFRNGAVTSSGATRAVAEGFTLNGSQRTQLTDAVLAYANEYLESAPGLDIGSAKVTADGISVTGTAPDRLEIP